MRVTVLSGVYASDTSSTAYLMASLAEHRAELGDEVTVVTGRGGDDSYEYNPSKKNVTNPRVVCVWAPRLGKGRLPRRLFNYGLFYLLSAWRMLTLPRQDVIIALTTPPFIAWTAVLHKMLHSRTRLVLWNMECYPEVAERTGVISPGKLASRIMRALNRSLFRRLDHIVCPDSEMLALLQSQYDAERHLAATVVPGWEKATFFKPDLSVGLLSEEGNTRIRGRLVVLHTGNMGRGYSFETVIKAAQMLRDEPVTFVFAGVGSQLKMLEEDRQQHKLSNIVLRGHVDKQQLRDIMAVADCALITFRDEMLGVTSPSKMYASLAMRLATIYVGPSGSTVDEAINMYDCGASLRNGDSQGMVDVIRTALADPRRLADCRARARQAFEESYCDQRVLPWFDAIFDRFAVADDHAIEENSLASDSRPDPWVLNYEREVAKIRQVMGLDESRKRTA